MAIYIILVLLILLSMAFGGGSNSNGTKTGITWLRVVFIFIFLLCALRSSSVGRDVPGYEKVYEWTQVTEWDNWDYVYFEVGYQLLMKLCVLIGLSFQGFLAIAYAIILYPIYLFIKKYSCNYGFSTLVFVCFQYLNFDLSGIRQAISMSIVLIGYIVLVESRKYHLLKFIIISLIAFSFHRGAAICFAFIAFYLIKSTIAVYYSAFVGLSALFFFRNRLMVFIRDVFEKQSMETEAGLYVGTTFIISLVLVIVFSLYLEKLKKRRAHDYDIENEIELNRKIFIQTVNFKLFLVGFASMVLFGAANAVRSYMVVNQVILTELPEVIESKMFGSRRILYLISVIVLLFLFSANVIISGGFDIVPYKFFWQSNV